MIYRASADAKIEVGGWPQFFKSVFHVYAKSEKEAKAAARVELEKSVVEYSNFTVELIGRRYEVFQNDEFSVAGVRFIAESVSEVHVYEGTMQISILGFRNGKADTTSIAVWCRPVDFQKAVEGVFASMRYKEI